MIQKIKKSSKRRLGKQSREVAEETKKKILMAALKVFAEEGYPDARLRDIAAYAGATHGLIRHHFGAKDDLWKAVVDYGFRVREDLIRRIVDTGQSTDPVELFKKLIKSHIIFVAENPELAKILIHSDSRNSHHLDYIFQKRKTVNDMVAPIFEKAKACGYFKGFDHDSFIVYMRAMAEGPIATAGLTNKLLKNDIRSEKGIELHTQRVIDFLFRRDE